MTYIVLIVAALTLLLAWWRWRDFYEPAYLLRHEQQEQPESEEQPPYEGDNMLRHYNKHLQLSVVVPACNQAAALRTLIPVLMQQQFEGKFEVIVVNAGHADDTEMLLEQWREVYPNLRSTSIPSTARYIAPRKLAITLGIRAARSEWALVLHPGCVLHSAKWLSRFARYLTDDCDYVAGYINYDDDGTLLARRAIYERLRRQQTRWRAWRNGVLTGGEAGNYALRKSWFMQHQGFADSLALPFGEEDILLAHHGDAARCRFVVSPALRVGEEMPTRAALAWQRVEVAETLRHQPWRVRLYAWRNALATLSVVALVALVAVYAALRLWADGQAATYTLQAWPCDAAIVLLSAAAAAAAIRTMHRGCQALEEREFTLYMCWHALWQPWRSGFVALRRWMHRRDFVRRALPAALNEQ